MVNNPNIASWASTFIVSDCGRFSFSLRILSSMALPGPSSVDRNGGGDGDKQRVGDFGKKDLADAPSTSNDMSVIICEDL